MIVRQSSSSSGNGTESRPTPPARPKRLSKQISGFINSARLHARKQPMKPPTTSEDFPSPGEIVTTDPHATVERESISGGRIENDGFRDLSGTDLVVLIDLQQSLLDRLNSENRELTMKTTELQNMASVLSQENDRLRSSLTLQTASSNMDYMLRHMNVDDGGAVWSKLNEERPKTVAAQVSSMQAEMAAKDREIYSKTQEIGFLERQLEEKAAELEELTIKSSSKTEVRLGPDFDALIQTLEASMKRLKAHEEELLEEVGRLQQQLASLKSEHLVTVDGVHRREVENTNSKLEHEAELRSLHQTFRTEKEKLLADTQTALEHEQLRSKDLREQMENVSEKLANERSQCEEAKTHIELLKQQKHATEQQSAEGLRHVQFELAEMKVAIANAEHQNKIERHKEEVERNLFAARWKQSEDRLIKLREQFRDTEAEWAAVGRQHSLLLEKVVQNGTSASREGSKHDICEGAVVTDSEESDTLKRRLEEGNKQLVLMTEETARTDEHMQILLRGQNELIEKFRAECLLLADKLDGARRFYRKELERIGSFNAEIGDRYAGAVDLNQRLLAECRLIQLTVEIQSIKDPEISIVPRQP